MGKSLLSQLFLQNYEKFNLNILNKEGFITMNSSNDDVKTCGSKKMLEILSGDKDIDTIKNEAKEGDVSAQVALMLLYSAGNFVEKDINQAYKWAKLAAEKGNELAQTNIINFSIADTIEQLDSKLALKYAKELAKKDNKVAILGLAIFYYIGKYVERDVDKAVEYLEHPAVKDDVKAQQLLAEIYFRGESSRGVNYKKALECVNIGIKAKSAQAYLLLGKMNENGLGVPKNEKEAFRLYRLSLNGEEAFGAFRLALCYRDGIGTKRNPEKAAKWFKVSVDGGYEYAKEHLADMYFSGDGVPKNYSAVIDLLKDMAEYLDGYSQCMLGLSYLHREKEPDDIEKGIYWVQRAAEQGNEDAIRLLPDLFETFR